MEQDTFKPTLQINKSGKSVLIITDDKVQDLELFYPYYRLVEEGFNVDIASPKGGDLKGEAGWPIKNTLSIESIDPANYDLLYIPGGKAPGKLMKVDAVLNRVKQFAQSGKPIAAFCHGPQVLAAADLVRGKTLTAYPEVEKEISKAGGNYVNEALHDDGQFITSRWPGDLPGHMKAVLKKLSSASPQNQQQKIAS